MAERRGAANRATRGPIPVLDVDGRRVGWTAPEEFTGDTMAINSGLLIPRRVEVPRAWVAEVSASCVRLKKPRRAVERIKKLSEPPTYPEDR